MRMLRLLRSIKPARRSGGLRLQLLSEVVSMNAGVGSEKGEGEEGGRGGKLAEHGLGKRA